MTEELTFETPPDAGRGPGGAKGRGHGEDDPRPATPGAPSLGGVPASEHGISAAALGSLNAAHASSTARAHAAPNSMVGQIAAFASAAESNQVEAAAQALAAKANKPITEPVVTEVARHAQIEVSEETARAIAERAAVIQDRESEGTMGASTPGGS